MGAVWRRLLEISEAAAVGIHFNSGRFAQGPSELVAEARKMGIRRRNRVEAERKLLQRTIRIVDRLFPSGPNCYRRALIEIAMDAGAAAEPLHMGLMADGTPNSGHVWLASSSDRGPVYDVEFVV
jgi:hypothetical protein